MPTQFAFTQLAGMPGSSINAVIPHLSTVETITATGSNQSTTAVAAAGQTICRVATDAAVYVEFGTAPDASSDGGGRFFIPAGAIEYFAVSTGHKAAAVTA